MESTGNLLVLSLKQRMTLQVFCNSVCTSSQLPAMFLLLSIKMHIGYRLDVFGTDLHNLGSSWGHDQRLDSSITFLLFKPFDLEKTSKQTKMATDDYFCKSLYLTAELCAQSGCTIWAPLEAMIRDLIPASRFLLWGLLIWEKITILAFVCS